MMMSRPEHALYKHRRALRPPGLGHVQQQSFSAVSVCRIESFLQGNCGIVGAMSGIGYWIWDVGIGRQFRTDSAKAGCRRC
jgi:hypothetical protein